MNICHLLFTSMIFCAVPIVCVASKVNIHDQARNFFLVHKKLIQVLPPKLQELMKQYVSLKKETYSSNLNQMPVDICDNNDGKWKHTIDQLTEKSNLNMDEKNILNCTCVLLECYLGHIGILSFDGTFHKDLAIAKEDDVVIIKKRIAHLSSLLESCSVASKVTDSKQNFIVQTQEIVLDGYVNFIKALRPELRRYIKNKFFIKKRVKELTLKEMKVSKSIEDIKQKVVAIEMDLESAIDNSNLDHMSLNEIWALYIVDVFWDFSIVAITGRIKPSSKEVTEKDIADTKKIIEHLEFVLQSL